MSDAYMLGNPDMDQNHSEFLAYINALKAVDKTSFATLFLDFVAHTEAHFDQENQWMEEYAFPAISEHRGEHQRVLTELSQFAERVQKGSQLFARAWVTEHALEWFESHIATMDTALANHLKVTSKADTAATPCVYKDITVEKAELIAGDPDALIIDTRDAMSYKAGHIPGAMFFHESLLQHILKNKDFARPVLVYCYQGNSSKDVARMLAQSGFKNCYNLSGGYTAWQKQSDKLEEA